MLRVGFEFEGTSGKPPYTGVF